jgi:hypothetical protein
VVDERGGEGRALGGTRADGVGGGGGGGERLDQAPAADLAVLEVVKLLCDEPFHGGSPHRMIAGGCGRPVVTMHKVEVSAVR